MSDKYVWSKMLLNCLFHQSVVVLLLVSVFDNNHSRDGILCVMIV